MGRVIAVASQKGGVGKTTTTINLGACLAQEGQRVLIVDVDPQGNASSGLGVNGNTQPVGVYEALLGPVELSEAIVPTIMKGLELMTSGQRLSGAEVELVGVMARETRLKSVIGAIRDRYDFILIDCPPSLGLLTVNALTAADSVLIPLQCEYLALEGLTQLIAAIRLVQDHLNSSLRIEGVLLTMFDSRLNLAQQVVDEARKFFSDRVYKTVIPRSVRLGEAPSFGKPIVLYDPHSTGALRYSEMAQEVLGNSGASRSRGAVERPAVVDEHAGEPADEVEQEDDPIEVASATTRPEQVDVVVHADAMHAGAGDTEEYSDRPDGSGQDAVSQPGSGGSDECTERPSVEVSRP